MEVTVIGHGSLMSGQGLSFSGTLQVKAAGIVALSGCVRGFAKLSRYGDRFATDVESHHWPLTGRLVTPTTVPNGEVEALALTVSLEDFYRLVKREGYSPAAMQRVATVAQEQGQSLADFLWQVHEEAAHDRVAYRRRLWENTGFTSSHYIPHPVQLAGESRALIFVAPGFEGTGADEVISVRQETGIREVMNTCEAWRRKPNEDQLAYFLSCMLGGVHGVNVRDLLLSAKEEPLLVERLRAQLNRGLAQELERFLGTTSLSREHYQRIFGDTDAALERSGLAEFLFSEHRNRIG
jgi:hypothetical protein